MLVTKMIEKARTYYPKKYGVICRDEKFTYSPFGERVDRLSNTPLDFGSKKGGTGAIFHRDCFITYGSSISPHRCMFLPLIDKFGQRSTVSNSSTMYSKALFPSAECWPAFPITGNLSLW